jgi:hypothetical protein
MSNQIVISSGAKVRSLEGVLTGTAGIVNSVPLGGANGVATLDSNGKVPLSQLPASVVTYLGTWNASTNTPTLTNGVGDTGDLYICNVAGTVNFGAGPITFAVGDWVIYSGTQWQKSAGASGTVTSVALSESGDALTITGSPITTSGTINIGFAGTSGQYINGAGNLTTFPSLTGFVPYTGATANLDLGTFDLTTDIATLNQVKAVGSGGLSFNSNSGTQVALMGGGGGAGTTFYGGIIGTSASFASSGGSDTFAINHSSGSGIALNITKGGNGEGLYINKTSGSGNAATIIGTLNATTLVKNGGTSSQFLKADGSVDSNSYVTINTTQTITGEKVFNNNALFNSVLSVNYGAWLQKGVPSATFSSAFTTLYSEVGAINAVFRDNTNQAKLQFQSASNYTYTFPAATGTIALTSDLSSYVPYSGATSNVNLGTYNLTTTGNVNATNFVGSQSAVLGAGTLGGTLALFPYATYTTNDGYLNIVASSTTKLNLIFGQGSSVYKTAIFDVAGLTNSVNRTYTLPDITGTFALLEGTQTFTGAKTFGLNNLIADGGILFKDNAVPSSYTTGYVSAWFNINGTKNSLGLASSVTSPVYYTYDFPNASGTLVLGTGTTNYLPKFTGASTLGNSLIFDNGTNVGIGTASPSDAFQVYNTSASNARIKITGTTNFSLFESSNTSGSLYIGIDNSAGSGFGVGNYSRVIWSSGTGYPIVFATQDAERMRITSAGNVGIGTSSPVDLLTLNATSTSTVFTLQNGAVTKALLGVSYAASDLINNSAAGDLNIRTNNTNLNFSTNNGSTLGMRITSGGDVFIGTTTNLSSERTFIQKSGTALIGVNRVTDDGGLVRFYQDGTEEGNITVSGSTVSYNSFLGSHWSQLQDGSKPEILKGTILEAIDELCIWENEFNDRLPKSKISDTIDSKNVYGVFLAWDEEWEKSNDFYVAAVGLGYIRVHSSQNVSMGDLLQSNGDGTAKIQEDDIMRSSTIAKVVSTQKIETYEDGSYLIAATLHCG